jgi:hypothetical protein
MVDFLAHPRFDMPRPANTGDYVSSDVEAMAYEMAEATRRSWQKRL